MAHQSIARKRLYRNSFKSKPIRWMGRQQFVRNVADELKSCWSGICIRHLKTDPRVRFKVGATIFWPLKVPAFQFRLSLLKELWKLRVEGLSTCRCLSKRQPTESRDFWFFFFFARSHWSNGQLGKIANRPCSLEYLTLQLPSDVITHSIDLVTLNLTLTLIEY